MKQFTVRQIGTMEMDKDGMYVKLLPEYIPALKSLEGFGHADILWWFDACDDEEHDAARRGDHPPSQLKLPVLAFGMEALGALQGIVPGDLVAVIPPIGLRHLAGKGHGYGDLGAAADVLGGELGVLRAEFAQGAGGQIEDIPPVLVLDRPRVGFALVDRD